MATWKKVVVSGSNISQLNNDAGYLTSVTLQNAFATASFNGTELLANGANGNLTFASSSGQGLNITANAGSDTLTFGLSAIPNSSLANSTISGISLGSNLADLTAGAGLTAGGTYNGGTARTFSVNSSSMAPYFATQSWAGITGDVTINNAGVSAIGTGVIVNADVNASAAIDYTKINFAGSSYVSASVLSSPGQGQALLTTNGVAGSTIDLGLETGDSPQFVGLTLTGDLAVNGADITTTSTGTATLFNTNATTVNIAGAGTTVNIGNASGTTTIAGNAVVQGDFTVNGTTTYVNVQDLYVEDKFIVLASGSTASSDGGIIIDRGSDAAGNIAYGFDSVTDRWGFQSGLADSTNTFDPTSNSGVSGSFVPYLFTEASHGSTKPITGEFAVVGSQYMDAAGNFWVYTV